MVDVVDGPCPKRLKRVVVTTFAGLGEPAVEIEKKDILIIPNATEALEAYARFAIPHAERARLYGFLEIGRHLALYDADWVAAMFGLEEVVIPRHGFIRRPVEVVAVKGAGGQGVAANLDSVALKREGLWRHGLRNRRIAALARAVADADHARLRAECPAVAARLASRGGTLKVAVLVENIEHALAIAGRLPDWPIKTGLHVATVGLPAPAGSAAGAAAVGRRGHAGPRNRHVGRAGGVRSLEARRPGPRRRRSARAAGAGRYRDPSVRAHHPPAPGCRIRRPPSSPTAAVVTPKTSRLRGAGLDRGWCRSGHDDRAVPGQPAGGGAMSTYSRTRFRKNARPGKRPGDYYRRRRQRRALGQMETNSPTLAGVADPEHLIATFHAMKAEAGRAPGPDRVTFEVLGPSEVAACLRAVSKAIMDGSYRPGPSRKLPIPKPGGGHRTLTIRNLIDRVVSKAIYRRAAAGLRAALSGRLPRLPTRQEPSDPAGRAGGHDDPNGQHRAGPGRREEGIRPRRYRRRNGGPPRAYRRPRAAHPDRNRHSRRREPGPRRGHCPGRSLEPVAVEHTASQCPRHPDDRDRRPCQFRRPRYRGRCPR